MNKKYLILWLFKILVSINLLACDVCNIFEYANRSNKSYLGVFTRYRVFNGYKHLDENHLFFINSDNLVNGRISHEPDGMMVQKSSFDFERYLTTELRANFNFRDKWNFTILVPFSKNEVYYKSVFSMTRPVTDSAIVVKGVGDIIIASDYVKTVEQGKFKHYIKPGIALKLPTGAFNKRINNQMLMPDIQLGTGSIDVIFRLNYMLTYASVGLDIGTNYKLNTKNSNEVLFGNSLNLNSNLFYVVELNEKWRIIPRSGVYIEQAQKDRIQGKFIETSGGKSYFGNMGLDVVYKSFTIQTLCQLPVYEQLNGPVIGNAGRLIGGVLYNF